MGVRREEKERVGDRVNVVMTTGESRGEATTAACSVSRGSVPRQVLSHVSGKGLCV